MPLRLLLPLLFVVTSAQAAAPLSPQAFRYSLYAEMAAAHSRGLAERDLFDRLVARGPQGLLIRFPAGSEARAAVHLKSGTLRYVADDRDELRLPDKREWHRDNPHIELSVAPLEVVLDFGG